MPPDIPTDPGPYAAFIARYLMQPVAPGSSEPRAAAETEAAVGGDRWFWADDNAKVLEFLTLPAVWRRHPREVADAFRFLASLCHGPFILRRRGHPRLEEVSNDGGGRARFAHTFMSIECDLPKGVVQVGMRFHDGRNARNLTLTGNHVQFVQGGVRHTLDAEDAIAAWDIRRGDDGRLRLWHASELFFDGGGTRLRLGRLTYAYGFDARSMAIDAEAALDLDPAAGDVSEVVLTIGQDDLSHGAGGVGYGALHAEVPGPAPPLRVLAGEPAKRRHPAPGAAYWCLAQRDGMRGFALGIHSLPREPARVSAFRVAGRVPDRLHWVASEHLFPAPARGARLVAAERKWITSGGFYDRVSDCAGLLRGHDAAPGAVPLDLSVSYDYGAELGAFARCVRGLSGDGGPSDPRLRDEARALYDRYLGVYAENLLGAHRGGDAGAVFSRPLAFVAQSLVDMLAATGEARYREMLRGAMEVLLAFQRTQTDVAGGPSAVFLMGQSGGSAVPFMDCHSAALLALVRAMPVLEDERFAAALDHGLGAYCLATLRFELGRLRSKQDTVGVDFVDSAGKRRVMGGEWNFCAALTLRAFKALRRSRHPAIQAIEEKHRDRLGLLAAVMHDQIRRSMRPREGGALEVRTSVLSGEGNSETQPWAALALAEDALDD
ncbi:hypothetical protein GCM10009416_31100 [Craurococcus roseus]|uniref:Heparinase n=1 Tax=Craurococcus roseus TaxID=77585 RepID=A0ABN1FGP6_9PROT